MLDTQSWLTAAQALTQGQRSRVPHDCGSGKVLLIENKPEGWSAWCHRCSDKGWHPKPQPSLQERLARLQTATTADAKAAADVRPPMPAEFDPSLWPIAARVWLYKAGLSNDRIQALGFYWNPDMRRVVMPVLCDRGRLVYWQARGFDDRPKYINPEVDKPLYKQGSGLLLVLTEDMLSAARVGEVTAAWSILGTSADDGFLTDIVATGLPVRVWLDPDKAGLKGRRKLVTKLRAYGVDAVSIKTAKDPKFYSNEEIRKFLWT
jgi:hypothetical protein